MNRLFLGLLASFVVAHASRADDSKTDDAIRRGLERVRQGAANYPTKRQCFSCHHQALPAMTLVLARNRGFVKEAEPLGDIVTFSLKTFRRHDQLKLGQGVGGANTTVGYALATLADVHYTPDETTAALVQFLLARQAKDGSWAPTTTRPPTEGSPFTSTALALVGLKKYGAPDILDVANYRPRIDTACGLAREWLEKAPAKNTEDKVFRLRGLVAAGADPEVITRFRKDLTKEQKHDGSWSQLPDAKGDAYATGSVLTTLCHSGLPATDPASTKGVQYLLSTQKDDGSWLVETRSRPIQAFFDNGDPHGKSQFISFMATNWAVQAILETRPKR